MLEIEDLTVSIDGRPLIKDINMTIEKGETRMLFGENGSGKTSLLMAIMGLGKFKVDKGRIIFKGKDITNLPTNERAAMGIGIMFQRPPTITGLRVMDMLKLINGTGEEIQKLAESMNFGETDICHDWHNFNRGTLACSTAKNQGQLSCLLSGNFNALFGQLFLSIFGQFFRPEGIFELVQLSHIYLPRSHNYGGVFHSPRCMVSVCS